MTAAARPRWGLTLPCDGIPLADHRAVVDVAAAAGYTDLWSSEASGADAFTPLALAAAWQADLRLGTAIVPVHTRGAAVLAMSAAALADAAPGRFALGIGASSPVIVERWNGVGHHAPYQRTRDTLRFLRRALTGERIDEAFETFTVRGFRLDRVPATPPPLLVAALRPQMLRLAGREADGVVLNWLSASDVPTALAELGPEGVGKEVVTRIFVCPTADAGVARAVGRRLVGAYLTVPVYAAFHRWLGRTDALAEMWRCWEAGDRRAAAAAVPDEVVDALIVHGDAEACRAHIRRYVGSGVTTPVLALLPTGAAATPGSLLDQIGMLGP